MNTTQTVLTVVGAVLVGFSAYSVFARASWVVEPLTAYGVPQSWWTRLGVAKAAGAVGLLVGLAVPAIWYAAAIGIVLYFLGAVATVIRARSYAHIPFPLIYAAPAAIALVIGA